jgi:hypothetical protein
MELFLRELVHIKDMSDESEVCPIISDVTKGHDADVKGKQEQQSMRFWQGAGLAWRVALELMDNQFMSGPSERWPTLLRRRYHQLAWRGVRAALRQASFVTPIADGKTPPCGKFGLVHRIGRMEPVAAARSVGFKVMPKDTAQKRLQSIDLLRGLAIVLMARDHTRDFFGVSGPNPRDIAEPAVCLKSLPATRSDKQTPKGLERGPPQCGLSCHRPKKTARKPPQRLPRHSHQHT